MSNHFGITWLIRHGAFCVSNDLLFYTVERIARVNFTLKMNNNGGQ